MFLGIAYLPAKNGVRLLVEPLRFLPRKEPPAPYTMHREKQRIVLRLVDSDVQGRALEPVKPTTRPAFRAGGPSKWQPRISLHYVPRRENGRHRLARRTLLAIRPRAEQ